MTKQNFTGFVFGKNSKSSRTFSGKTGCLIVFWSTEGKFIRLTGRRFKVEFRVKVRTEFLFRDCYTRTYLYDWCDRLLLFVDKVLSFVTSVRHARIRRAGYTLTNKGPVAGRDVDRGPRSRVWARTEEMIFKLLYTRIESQERPIFTLIERKQKRKQKKVKTASLSNLRV